MLTKLTLTIEQDVVAKAKSYAQKKKRSVSKIVEDYLNTVSDNEKLLNAEKKYEGSLTDSIAGMFEDEYKGQPCKELLEDAILEGNI